MTKKYLYSRKRFASHLDNKIEGLFEKTFKQNFEEYFAENPSEFNEECITQLKQSMVETIIENTDLFMKELQRRSLQKEEPVIEEEQQRKPKKKHSDETERKRK
jgi:L-lactate utilization protein LutC